MSYAKEIGRMGEDLVADFLRSKGYVILRRNYYSRYGEIDIIAESPETLLFVEVKTRRENSLVSPADAVDYYKERKIANTAYDFLRKLHLNTNVRFDVAEVTYKIVNGEKRFSLNYIKNAFSADFLMV